MINEGLLTLRELSSISKGLEIFGQVQMHVQRVQPWIVHEALQYLIGLALYLVLLQ